MPNSNGWFIIILKWGKLVESVCLSIEKYRKGDEVMLLVGEYRHAIDAKNRLFIPAKHREQLGESFIITRKMEKCLALYSDGEWQKFTDKLNTLPDSVVGEIKQFLFPKTMWASPDAQGRVVITPELRSYAELDKNVVIIGVGDHAQIWSESRWQEKESKRDTDAMVELLRKLGL